ncbi:CD59 glycoprotein isoform X1 [Oryctolagus cuniculus]|uniref:CD59 glycoprotein isoform X1 n=2 Tax=Oryctolagus cuniculus TaxID=9986 RepID=UPI00387958A9
MFVKEIPGKVYDWSLQKQSLGHLPSLDKITVGSCLARFALRGGVYISLSLVAAVFPLQHEPKRKGKIKIFGSSLFFIFDNPSKDGARNFASPGSPGGGLGPGAPPSSGKSEGSCSRERSGAAPSRTAPPGGGAVGPRPETLEAARRVDADSWRRQRLWTFMMTSRGVHILLRLLFLLAVFYSSDSSLMCYHCLLPSPNCSMVTNCTPNHDACLTAVSGPRVYRQCWRYEDCNFEFISNRLEENSLKYNCCRKDLCNGPEDDGTALTGRTVLLVAPLLAAARNLCL